jgi:hypothetical protein
VPGTSQVPLVWPSGMAQEVPAQQSAFAVHAPCWTTHAGVTHLPPLHVLEQHWDPAVQVAPSTAQAVGFVHVPPMHWPWQQPTPSVHPLPRR